MVIVGGGVSGLTAAYRLQHRDFLLLEKEPHWGGNAYAMEYEGSVYATGSAFLAKDEYAYPFAKEIGLELLPSQQSGREHPARRIDPRYLGRRPQQAALSAAIRESFKKFKKEMLAIDREKNGQELSTNRFRIS